MTTTNQMSAADTDAPPANPSDALITATLVPAGQRAGFLPKHFGGKFLHVIFREAQVYNTYKGITGQAGGYYEFYELSNGGWFMAPRGDKPVEVTIVTNGYSGTMSPHAAGIVACLFVLNRICNETEEDGDIDAFYALRSYAMNHAEAGAIFAAID